jgi:phenylalanyl-tRNA synthetase beta chain
MGHIGVARDLKAFLNVHEGADSSIIYPEINFEEGKNEGVKLNVSNTDMCPRYMGVTIENITVESSPEWLQNRLRAIGIGPINNVVDITNYVMHELGNPLHAFDAAVVNGTVEVKTVADKTKFTTLDETERELRNEDLMICNAEKPMCIAGVFGGIDSGVSDNTTSIFLESAYFNPVAVRKTAKAHGLNTDASFRFERGVDPETVACALKRAASMICEIAGGQVSSKIVDSNPDFKIDFEVDFNYENCHRLIGHTIEEYLIDKILKELDIEIVSKSNKDLKLKVPGYRVDVQREADVIEEVLRIYGFNKVPMPEKLNASLSYSSNIDPEVLQSRISDLLTSNGFNELFNNSLTSSKMETEQGEGFINPEFHVKMLNALSIELDVMRQTMLFSGLQSIAHNINRKSADLKMYEFGKTYHKFESGYTENREISLFVTGAQLEESWNATNDKVDFYSLRGALKSILTSLGMTKNIKEASFEELPFEFGTKVKIGKKEVAKLGLVSKKIAKSFGIKQDVYFAQINWDALIELQMMNTTKFKALPKTMAARRDFSLLVNESVKYADIRSIAEQTERKLLRSVGLFDVYEGDKLPEGKKSYAVKFTFQDDENTLKDAQIDAVMNKIQAKLEKELGAELR